MEPLRTTINDCMIKYNDIIHSSKVLSIQLIRCDDHIFNGITKEEIIEETDYSNDSKVLQIRVVPLPPNVICGNQEFNENTKQEIVDDQIFNGIIKEEIIDTINHHNDSQLFQIRTETEEKITTIDANIKTEIEVIDGYVFEETVTCMNSNLTSNGLRENSLANNCVKMSMASNLTVYPKSYNHEKLYICDICDQGISRKANLRRHIMTHIGKKPYKCDVCDKAFFRAEHLKMHTRTHTGEKPYQCKICVRAFSQNSHLILHTRTHTGERPYKCDICDKRFNSSSDLTKHTRTHTGKKSYECDICDSRFSTSLHLKRHAITHTRRKHYQCDNCDKCFTRTADLERHARKHAKEKI